ncbi:Gp49 family protein [Pectinatus frisingensis]|uniref:Gp49 family protein n=1 Tax=Pectinatus frisingensis TaxID=865 RepID=UPI003D8032A5
MKTYIGTKLIKAEPAYQEIDLKHLPAKARDGYRVVYPDGYESWSPKDVFEKAYHQFGSDKNTVTQADVDGFIAKKEVSTVKANTTLVIVTLVNGFILTESSACVDPTNYDQKYGAEICMKKIKDKIWFLLGFLLQCGINGLNGGK